MQTYTMANETLVTISQRTGFSISTISRVLNGQAEKYRISATTVRLIEEEAKRCNYIPNLLAKGLTTRRTNIIGLLIPSVDNPYFANIASVVIRQAKTQGFTTMIVDTMENEKNEQQDVLSLISRKVDGIIIVPCDRDPAFLERISKHNIPIVLIDRYFNATSLPYVCTDNYQGGYEATMHLIGLGHERIACIQGVPYSMPNKERVRGYREALRQNNLEINARISGTDFSVQNGYLETKLLLNGPSIPTAIFTLSNTILLGAVKAIRESGFRIPQDISIISFDNNTYLDYLDPAVTRVSQPTEEIGILAVKILTESIADNKTGDTQILIPPKLIVCNSVSRLAVLEK